MTHPKISVIVSNYNHERWIGRCLRSVFTQNFLPQQDYEIIVTDDCSSDNSLKIIQDIANSNKNIRVITNKKNLGLQKSINHAIKQSFGQYIVRVDSDDYVSNFFLFFMYFYLNKNRKYHGVCVDYNLINSDEEIIERRSPLSHEISCAVMYRKDCLIEIGLYDEKFEMREGHELKQRFLKKFKMGYIEIPLYNYRMHETNRTKNTNLVNKFDNLL